MKSKSGAVSASKSAGREDEKMHNIVDEVDKFFKSVHADIEDWKFSMEDYGDGTRIFVRFQIHFDKSVVSPSGRTAPARTPAPVALALSGDHAAGPGGPPPSVTVTVPIPEDGHGPDATGTAGRAEMDLASFVEDWRRKRDTSQGGEFHKEGAPFLDGRSEWNGQKRSGGDVAPSKSSERNDEDPGTAVART
jgi:hypothetical protein